MNKEDHSTEEKIKNAARELFHQKGFEGTRTRDIADAAGINQALMNYYFRSKKKLFDLIMMETIEAFIQSVVVIFQMQDLNPDQKIKKLANHYIDMLLKEPDLPVFVLSELRSDPSSILKHVLKNKAIQDTPFFHLLRQSMLHDTHNPMNPAQNFLNFIAMTVFPFAAKPLFENLFGLDDNEFKNLMEDRKDLIPIWIEKLFTTDYLPEMKDNDE